MKNNIVILHLLYLLIFPMATYAEEQYTPQKFNINLGTTYYDQNLFLGVDVAKYTAIPLAFYINLYISPLEKKVLIKESDTQYYQFNEHQLYSTVGIRHEYHINDATHLFYKTGVGIKGGGLKGTSQRRESAFTSLLMAGVSKDVSDSFTFLSFSGGIRTHNTSVRPTFSLSFSIGG